MGTLVPAPAAPGVGSVNLNAAARGTVAAEDRDAVVAALEAVDAGRNRSKSTVAGIGVGSVNVNVA